MTNIFQDPTKVMPKGDSQIVRVSMKENEVGGRTDHLPAAPATQANISHVPNK